MTVVRGFAPPDGSVQGVQVELIAGETIAFGDPVFVKSSDGKAWKADADTSGKFPIAGIASDAANSSDPVGVVLVGVIVNASWTWTPGGIVYLSTSSGLTQTQPSATDNAITAVGFALDATTLFVVPQLIYITHV